MKAAIFGVRDAEYVKEAIEKSKDSSITVLFFVDNNEKLWGTYIGIGDKKIKIISCRELRAKYQSKEIEAVIVAVRNGHNRWSIVNQLQREEIVDIGLVKPNTLTYRWPIKFRNIDGIIQSDEIVWIKEIKKPIIYYLEFHAMDSCNLNCKGCLHFSNLFRSHERPDMDRLIRDIQQLSNHCYLFHVRVLGGEPLLNPELSILLKKLREVLPDSDIGVVTNGTLITRQDEKLFDVMRENRIGFNITFYPPTYEKKDEICNFLDKRGVSYGSNMGKIDEFSKGFMLNPKKGQIISHTKCVSKDCFFVREGKLYKCAVEALINKFYETYDIPISIDGGIDIYDETINWGKRIPEIYRNPVSLCRYCSDKLETFEWKTANSPQQSDWIIG